MKKLCFGTYISVLVRCKAHSVSQKQLIGQMLLAVNKNYDVQTDDAATAALARGKNNLSNHVTSHLDDIPAEHLSAKFNEVVVPFLDANKKRNIVLAYKDILREDTEIVDVTKVELVNQLTKADILERENFVLSDLLTGLFLYVAKYTSNHDMKDSVKEITDDYLSSFESSKDVITFVSSYSLENIKQIREAGADARLFTLMAEQEGNCPLCGKPLQADNCRIERLDSGEETLLCLECSVAAQRDKPLRIQAMEVRESQRIRYRTRSTVSDNKLIDEVRELIEKLNDVSPDDVKLRYTPLSIENKVSDRILQMKIRGYIVDGMYDAVNSCIDNLTAENKLNARSLSKCIRRTYEDASETTTSQSDIFNAIVKYIYAKTGQKYYEACELLVSYFVQRCEVFNEITE